MSRTTTARRLNNLSLQTGYKEPRVTICFIMYHRISIVLKFNCLISSLVVQLAVYIYFDEEITLRSNV